MRLLINFNVWTNKNRLMYIRLNKFICLKQDHITIFLACPRYITIQTNQPADDLTTKTIFCTLCYIKHQILWQFQERPTRKFYKTHKRLCIRFFANKSLKSSLLGTSLAKRECIYTCLTCVCVFDESLLLYDPLLPKEIYQYPNQ